MAQQEEEVSSTLNTTPLATPGGNSELPKRENRASSIWKKAPGQLDIILNFFKDTEDNSSDHEDETDGCWNRPHVTSPTETNRSSISISDLFKEDLFQREVAQKTQMLMIGQQEAEAEVVIDTLIREEGSLEKALFAVVTQITPKWRVEVYVNLLLDRGARTSLHDDNWQTTLHHAVKLRYREVVSKLLEHNALSYSMDKKKKMPLHFAYEAGDDGIASILIKYMPNDVMNLFFFLFMLFCLTFSVIVAVMTPDPSVYDGPLHFTRAFFECCSLASVSITFGLEINQMRKHKLEYWKDGFNWIDLGSSFLILLVVPLRFTHLQQQWPVFAIGYLLWTLRIFKYASLFRHTGAYAQILWRIVSHDILQFTVVFLVILLAFSGTFVLSLRGDNSLDVHSETSTFWHVLFTGVRILIESQPIVDYTGDDGYKVMSCFVMVVFLFVCCVVLLNTLIAQLSDTYQNVQNDAHRGLELNRAWIIARVELNSLFIGKEKRASNFIEREVFANPSHVLEKWESPILTDIRKNVNKVKETLASTKFSIYTVKDRLSRQEGALSKIQEQLDILIGKGEIL